MMEGRIKEGDKVVAIMPNGEREYGIVGYGDVDDRLYLFDDYGNFHALDGGFLEGTKFEVIEVFSYEVVPVTKNVYTITATGTIKGITEMEELAFKLSGGEL